ncbi:MAG: MarR family transcriptional regulator [Lachnospiraceae bacterium]|nr:MarR family transcriptional regulator [Lachnospiraceae bacterium]
MDKYDLLKLDNQLCFPIYVCAKTIVNKYAPFLKEIDLTYTQYITMMVMWEEKKVTSGRLKQRLFLDSGTLTPVINRLVEKGYVTKQRSEEDGRDLIVTLTPEGDALKEKAVEVPIKLGSCIKGIDNPAELKETVCALMKILTEE